MQRLLAGEVDNLEMRGRIIGPAGDVTWVLTNTSVVRDDEGRALCFFSQIQDITKQIDSESRLRLSEERFRTLVDKSMDAILLTIPDGTVLGANPAAQVLFGMSEEEICASGRNGLIDEADPVLPGLLEERRRTGRARGRLRCLRGDGSSFVGEITSTVFTGAGNEQRTSMIIRDVTEEVQAQERLQRLDAIKTTLLHTLAHDLRSPLTTIIGSSRTIEDNPDMAEEDIRDLSATIARGGERMERMLQDLLDLERLDRGQLQPKRGDVEIDGLVDEVLEDVNLGRRELVRETSPVTASADRAMLGRILFNLLVNATKHTPATARISLRIQPTDEGVLIAVEDDGDGVPPELRDVIFDPFRQASPGQTAGTGVGLSLVREFAALHGGRAWVQDREGGGASFRVLLPSAEDPRHG